MFQLLLLKQNERPIAIKQSGVAFIRSSLSPYKSEIGVIKKNFKASNGLNPSIKKISAPVINVKKIARTGVKK